MAATIRLKRVGAKKDASYRIVVMSSRTGTSGPSVERIGLYNPRTQPSLIRIDAARTLYWLREGAEPSDTVRSLLRKTGVWKQFHEGMTPEALEEKVVYVGPEPGQATTSQRPAPRDEPARPREEPAGPAAKPAAKKKKKAAPAATVEPPDAAEEDAVAEPAREAEEAEGGEEAAPEEE